MLWFAAGEGSIDVAAGSATIACQISGTALVKTGCGILLLGAAFALPAQAAVEVDNGVLDLGRTTSEVSTVTLVSGSIIDGTISAGVAFDLESGTVLANLTGPAALNKQGQGTVVLAGANSYQGGTNALDGTLVAEMASSLPSAATGTGTVIVAAYALLVGRRRLDHWAMATGRRHAHDLGGRQQRRAGRRIEPHVVRPGQCRLDQRAGRCHDHGRHTLACLRFDCRIVRDGDHRFGTGWQQPGEGRHRHARAGRQLGLHGRDDRRRGHARSSLAAGRRAGRGKRPGDRPRRGL